MSTGNRIEVTAVGSDVTTIGTTSWTDGPEPPKVEAPKAQISKAGGPATAAPASPIVTADKAESRGTFWFGIGALVLALGAAVFVVRSLRSS